METLWGVYQLSQESMRCLDFFWTELRNSTGLEVSVEQLARVFPPLVVRREAKRPTKTHAIKVVYEGIVLREGYLRTVRPSLASVAWSNTTFVRREFNGKLDVTLPVGIYGRSLVKKVICNTFAVAHDEMKTKDLQMDDVGICGQ
jgi:hypothetical protein